MDQHRASEAATDVLTLKRFRNDRTTEVHLSAEAAFLPCSQGI